MIMETLLKGVESMASTERQHYLDLIKTLAVLCVCALHFPWCGDMDFSPDMAFLPTLRRFLFAFNACAVPLFLAVNGALLLNRPFDAKKHLRNTVRLFLAYVFWRALSVILIAAYQGTNLSHYNLTMWVNALLLLNDVPEVNLNHLWFLPMLLCIYVWLPLLRAAFDKLGDRGEGLSFFLPFLGFILIFGFLWEDLLLLQPVIPFFNAAKLGGLTLFLPLSGARYCSMLFYFIMGGLFFRYSDALRRIRSQSLISGILLALVLLYLEWRLNSSYSGETYDNVFLSYDNLPCLLLTASVFLLLQRCEEYLSKRERLCKLLETVGSNTMAVYYFHWILLSTVFERLHIADSLLFNSLKAVLLTAVCIVLSLALKKLPLIRSLLH